MTLLHILAATLLAGAVSVLAAGFLSLTLLSGVVHRLVSLSAGMLLGTAVLHLLPEAVESGANLHSLSAALLAGLIGFFLLEKISVLRHSHHYEGDGHSHEHGHDRHEAGPQGMLILVGDAIHNFADGVMIAAAFLVDVRLGWLMTAAIAAHEIPQEIGDFIVLLNAGYSKARALFYNLLSGLASVVGGVAAYFMLADSARFVPFVLMFAAASFIYVALADLVPDMHRQSMRRRRESAVQLLLMIAGVATIALLTAPMHAH